MFKTSCVICEQPIEGIRVSFANFLESAKAGIKVREYEIGSECEHCGATFCKVCVKKHLKFNILKGNRCAECGKPMGPGYFILSPDTSINEALLEYITDEKQSIDKESFSRIASLLDEREWEYDENVKVQLFDLLKDHGELFCSESLKDLAIGTELSQQDTIKKVDRIRALAEVSPSYLFAGGNAEDLLIHKIVHDKSSWITKVDYSRDDVDTLLPHVVSALIAIETTTRSGKSIPMLTDILLNNDSIHYRADTARQLGVIDWDPRVVEALIEALKDHKRPSRFEPGLAPKVKPLSVSERAVLSLIEIGNEQGLFAVIRYLAGRSVFAPLTDISFDGLNTVGMLIDIGKKAPVQLIRAFQDEKLDRLSAVTIAHVLGKTNHPEAVPALIHALEHDDSKVRMSAAVALGQSGDTRAFKPLLGLFTDTNKGVRRSAVKALEIIVEANGENLPVQELLTKALSDENPNVRAFAVEAIGDLNLATASDVLSMALEDDDAKVRKVAKKVMKKIGRST
jgi:HEAT repeat protein